MLRTLFVFAILVPGLAAAVRDRFCALLLYFWWALFRPDAWLWIDITGFRPSLVLGLLVFVPSILSGIFPNVTHPLSVGCIVFLATALVAQMNAIQPAIAWEWTYYFIRLLLIALLTINMLSTPRRLAIAQAVIAGSFGFFTAKAGLAYLLGGGIQFGEGVAGAFPDNEGYALGTAMIIPLMLATARNTDVKLVRWGFSAAAFLSIFTIIGTFSRGGFLALAVAVLALIVLNRRRVINLAGVAIVGTLVYAFAPIPQAYLDRLETISTYEEVGDRSALSRFHFWEVAIRMAEENPFGIGLHNFEPAYDLYDFSDGLYGSRRAVHSSHFEVLAETGYVGAVTWVALFGYAFLLGLRIRRRARHPALTEEQRAFVRNTANAFLASMSAFVVGGSFLAVALNDLTWLTFALLASLDLVSRSMVAERQTETARPQATAAPASSPWMVPA